MKKIFLTVLISMISQLIFCQACSLTNQITINSGFDPITNLALPVGSNDPRWIIDNANNIPGAFNNLPAVACIPSGGGAANPNSAWIGFATSSQYVTNNPTIGFYLITFRFSFRTCLNDSLFFDFNIANDNYCSELRIDGIPTGFSQPVGLATANWTSFTNYLYSDFYFSGNHTIEIDIQNYNVAGAMNPHMLNLFGTLTSTNNSIVTFVNPPNCFCNVVNNDSVISNFSFNYPLNCDSTIIQFTDLSTAINSNIIDWNWNFGDGNTSNLQNPIHDYITSGVYNVSLVVTNNFFNLDTFTVVVTAFNNMPIILANASPPTVCPGTQCILSGTGGVSYTWSGGITNGIPFTPAATATYTVIGTDANGCTNTSTTVITVNPLPTIIANASPPAVCPGGSTILTGSGGLSYNWSGGITDGVAFTPLASSTYTVVGTDANGCTNLSSVTVTINSALPLTITPTDPLLCVGDSEMLTASGAVNYIWANVPGLNTYSGPAVWASPTVTTIYSVTGADANGCTGTSAVTINIINGIDIQLTKSNDVECKINTVQLQASGAQSYTWTPANLLTNANAQITNANLFQTTTFYVTGSTGSCTDMDSITVYFYNNDETGIIIPNAFSPNGDGLNDCLKIIHNANFTEYYFTIYNRWGEKVYETDDPNACWNGEHKNMPAPLETYFYYLKAQTVCGGIFKKGDITLIK